MTKLTTSALRAYVYRILDQVLQTGQAVEVERKGQILKIVPEVKQSRLDQLAVADDLVSGNPDSLAEISWESSWSRAECLLFQSLQPFTKRT